MEPLKIVVRYRDGRIVKRYVDHFDPDRPSFHLHEHSAGASPVEMGMDELGKSGIQGAEDLSSIGSGSGPQGGSEIPGWGGDARNSHRLRCSATRLFPHSPRSPKQ